MALPAGTTWEIRPGVGSDTNGGGFITGSSGTDFSQQNAAQYSFTDLVSISSLVVASVSHSFVSGDVGNLINIQSGTGFTPGFYQIVSVAGGQATLDRSPGTVGAGGTYSVGGALATIATPFAAASADNTFYVKATGTLTVTAALTPAIGNDVLMQFIGYSTTRGDGGRATWTTATNSVNLITFQNGAFNYSFENFIMSSTAGTPGDGVTNNNAIIGNVRLANCLIEGWRYGANGDFAIQDRFLNLILENCEVTNCTLIGVVNTGGTTLIGCYIHDNGSHGFQITQGATARNSGIYAERSVFYNNGGSGIYLDYGANQYNEIVNCASVGNVGDGLTIVSGNPGMPLLVWNSIFASNGGWGIGWSSSNLRYAWLSFHNNAYFGNTSGTVQQPVAQSAADVTLSGSPFNNPSGDDFSLNSTTGAGAQCKGAGYQGTMNGATISGNSIDIGAVQSASSGGGGGAVTNIIVSKNVTQLIVQEGY